MWINADEARNIANNAIIINTDVIIRDIMTKLKDAAKAGKYKENFAYHYPLVFQWEVIKKILQDRGYQVSADINANTFSVSVMW